MLLQLGLHQLSITPDIRCGVKPSGQHSHMGHTHYSGPFLGAIRRDGTMGSPERPKRTGGAGICPLSGLS